jgi:transposase InsO family protein
MPSQPQAARNVFAVYSPPWSLLSRLRLNTDRGSQYLAIRYTARLEQAGAITSVGSKGDCLLTG